MTQSEVEAHKAAYRQMPNRSNAYENLPLSPILPGEVARLMDQLPVVGGKKSHKLLGANSSPNKRSMFEMSMYRSADEGLEWADIRTRQPAHGERDPESMSPGDYVEVLFPTEERVQLCEECGGKGWYECRQCSGEGWGEDSRKCLACEGEGGRNCRECDGSQGNLSGTIITLAKTADDYFVMDAIFYLDYYNQDWDRDLTRGGGRTFICDQLPGLLGLVRSPEFRRLIRQEA